MSEQEQQWYRPNSRWIVSPSDKWKIVSEDGDYHIAEVESLRQGLEIIEIRNAMRGIDDPAALVASWKELCGAVERFNAVADEGLVGPIDKVTFEACKALRTALANAKAAKGGKVMGEKRTYTCEGGNIARNGPEGRGPTLNPQQWKGAGESYDQTDLNPVVAELNTLADRIAALEVELAREREAVRVLGEEAKAARMLMVPVADAAPLAAGERLWRQTMVMQTRANTDANPTARAAVKGGA